MSWRDRAGRILMDPCDPRGDQIGTPLDRRWLWRIAQFMAVSATTDMQRGLFDDLREYLHGTCRHHWLHYDADEVVAEHNQCLWCCEVEWLDGEVSQ